MYAAAGGASLASRQARQRQRQQKRNQQLQAKLHPPKLSVLSITDHGASTPTRTQSRQFHQLPTNYLRTPQTHTRKLSASYTAQSKLLLPIDEGNNTSVLQMRVQYVHSQMHHSHSHVQPIPPHPQYQSTHQQHNCHRDISSKLLHRHSGSSASSFHHPKLHKSATATLPLVSQMEATPPTTPSGAAEDANTTATKVETSSADHTSINLAHHDPIIVTPAAPMASPGHVGTLLHKQQETLTSSIKKTENYVCSRGIIDEEQINGPPTAPLERKCSVYRMRRNETFECQDSSIVNGVGSSVGRQLKDLQFNQRQQYEPLISNESHLCYKGLTYGRKWQLCAYCEEGICVCEHIECTRGRAAWLERGRRCSVQEAQQAACHRRWVKRNRIQDASTGGSSDDEDLLGVLRGPSTFANAFLYVGLGTIALGLVIAFVGTGEKGFKTVELRLIGPSLIGLGFVCCMLRILLCICPSHCVSTNKNNFDKDDHKTDPDYTTSLLRGESKRVSIARRTGIQPKYPLPNKHNSNKILNEGIEALRQIATTSLFMHNEQKTSLNRVVPLIKEPEIIEEHIPKETEVSSFNKQCDKNKNKVVDRKTTIGAGVPDAINLTTANAKASSNRRSTINTMSELSDVTLVSESAALLNEQKPSISPLPIASKLSRQRIAINHNLLQQVQPLFSAPFSTKNNLSDQDLQMETSLSVMQPSTPTLKHDVMTKTFRPSGLVGNDGALSRTTIASKTISKKKGLQEVTCFNLSEPSNKSSNIPTTYDSSSYASITLPLCTLSLKNTALGSNTNTTTLNTKLGKYTAQPIFLPGQIEDIGTATSEQTAINESDSKSLQSSMPRFSNVRFMFPSPLSPSSDSESECALSTSDASAAVKTSISHGIVLRSGSFFEPELLLSPAKLGH